MSQNVKDDVAALTVIIIIVAMVVGIGYIVHKSSVSRCVELGNSIGYDTKYVNGSCHIELREGYWVQQCDLPYHLQTVDCNRPQIKEEE